MGGGYIKKSRKQSRGDGCGEAGGEVPPSKKSQGGFLILGPPHKKSRGADGVPMGCGWGADEACLRARGGPMLRGFVDVLDR